MPDSNAYDIVVLGGGSGGYACAFRAAELGKRVALIERDKLGGTCLHRGCIPTKALLHAAELADQARESEKFGIRAQLEGIDMPGVHGYKDRVVTRLWRGLQGLARSHGVEVVEGEGRLISPTQVLVGDTVYEGAHVVLATGSRPKSLPGLDLDGERIITSDDALVLDRVPRSVVILGGG
ncbi:MAG: FAD-dependent oxidoreductase, partial [Micromonosporaceae bacterium]